MLTRTVDRTLRTMVHGRLQSLPRGFLQVRDPLGTAEFGIPGSEPAANLRIHDESLYRGVVLGGSVAFGEAYMDGQWSVESLEAFLELMALNRDFWEKGSLEWLEIIRVWDRFQNGNRRNTRNGARRNISEHYDLGDELYRCFLDKTMTYSAAYFDDETDGLREAQLRKLDRINEKLDLRDGQDVLEIGCGWGSYALRTVRTTPVDVTAVTLSENQYEHLRETVRREGLENRITVHLRDYRDLDGSYDRIVSVEMLEAVGEEYWDVYFETLERLLAPGGLVFLQTIHMRDPFYETYRKKIDFIQKHIFPGGFLPGLKDLMEHIAGTTLTLVDLEEIGSHYTRTLEEWRRRFLNNRDQLPDRFDEAFVRGWDYYLSYCRAGFSTGVLGDVQLLLERPDVLTAEIR